MSVNPQLISRVLNIINESSSNALLFARTNPAMAGAAVAGAGGLTILALPAVIVAPIIAVLNLLGFGSGGIVAGRLRRASSSIQAFFSIGPALGTLPLVGLICTG
jgi:hypothetical protein